MSAGDPRYIIERLDQSLIRLVGERARLCRELGMAEPVALSDLLARYEGPLTAEAIREIARAIEAACAEAQR